MSQPVLENMTYVTVSLIGYDRVRCDFTQRQKPNLRCSYVAWALCCLNSPEFDGLFTSIQLRKLQISALLALGEGNPLDSSHRGPVMRNAFRCHDVILILTVLSVIYGKYRKHTWSRYWKCLNFPQSPGMLSSDVTRAVWVLAMSGPHKPRNIGQTEFTDLNMWLLLYHLQHLCTHLGFAHANTQSEQPHCADGFLRTTY